MEKDQKTCKGKNEEMEAEKPTWEGAEGLLFSPAPHLPHGVGAACRGSLELSSPHPASGPTDPCSLFTKKAASWQYFLPPSLKGKAKLQGQRVRKGKCLTILHLCLLLHPPMKQIKTEAIKIGCLAKYIFCKCIYCHYMTDVHISITFQLSLSALKYYPYKNSGISSVNWHVAARSWSRFPQHKARIAVTPHIKSGRPLLFSVSWSYSLT